jgi:hypothetical protein
MSSITHHAIRLALAAVLVYAPATIAAEAQETVAATDGLITLPSGLQYRILKAGTGAKPTIDDSVVCHFRGTHTDGSEFTSSYGRRRPATVSLKRVIKGWAEALQLMPVGSKWQLVVPAQLAYGERGVRGRVPPNATVMFDIELIAIANNDARTARAGELRKIQIAFKLDPRLTQGLYMGERWVSPPTYTRTGTATTVTVGARASGLDANGVALAIAPTWASADTDIVTVTPGQGGAVTMTVTRAGDTTLRVTAGEVSRTLNVKSRHERGVLQVEITQEKPATN